MRKALRIISISAGIVSVVSAVVLGYIYLEDFIGHIKRMMPRLTGKSWSKNTDTSPKVIA